LTPRIHVRRDPCREGRAPRDVPAPVQPHTSGSATRRRSSRTSRRSAISDLYASPYLRARPGSLHGYDISNHNELNPEIGFRDEHAMMTAALREHGMGHLLDIVPNHMGIGESGNRWWMDVLENGQSSPFAKLLRHRLAPAQARAPRQGAAPGARRPVRRRCWSAAS
jgi:hypothetical protein